MKRCGEDRGSRVELSTKMIENLFKKGGTGRRILEYSIESLPGRIFENLSTEERKIPEYPQQVWYWKTILREEKTSAATKIMNPNNIVIGRGNRGQQSALAILAFSIFWGILGT
jgi:hypothetical protein